MQDIARTLEAVEIQEKKVGGDQHGSSGVNRIGGKKQTRHKTPQKKGRCFCCDQERHYSTDKNCPSRNETCNKCKRVGHFAVVCKIERSTENKFRSGNPKSRGGFKPKHKGGVQAVDENESLCFHSQRRRPGSNGESM